MNLFKVCSTQTSMTQQSVSHLLKKFMCVLIHLESDLFKIMISTFPEVTDDINTTQKSFFFFLNRKTFFVCCL